MFSWLQSNWFKLSILLLLLLLVLVFGIFVHKYKQPISIGQPEPLTRIVEVAAPAATKQVPDRRLDLPGVVKQWYSGVVQVECYIRSDKGTISVQSGSGLLVSGRQGLLVLSNKHVLSLDNDLPELCAVGLPNGTTPHVAQGKNNEGLDVDIVLSEDGLDWGYIRLRNSSDIFMQAALHNILFCKSKPELGTEVVIMGYPEVGADSDITVTRGIISGYDEPYFITDSKIGEGSSGGVAVQPKDNPTESCMVGIPTFAQIGEVVNLGRILDIQKILPLPL